MLYCNDVITLIKYDGEGYTVSTLSGVSWYDRTQVKTDRAPPLRTACGLRTLSC